MSDQHTTLAAILATPLNPDPQARTWVNGSFLATVTDLQERQAKTGRTFWVARLVDPEQPEVSAETAFFTYPLKYSGRLCRFGGGGMYRDEYQGKAKIGIGQKTTITVLDGSERAAAQVPQAQPQGAFRPAGRVQAQPAAQIAANGPQGALPRGPILGVTVGMAMNCAIRTIAQVPDAPIPGSAAWTKRIHLIASDVLRVAQALERGQLAPPASEREVPAPAPALAPQPTDESDFDSQPIPAGNRRMPAPGPGGSVALPQMDEDIPF